MYASQSKSLESNTLLSVEEIEEKIQQLITENTGLRSMFLLFLPFKIFVTFHNSTFNFPDTLQQNNTYMRQLSSTLVEWQEEVIRVQSVYQNKVERAKEVITKVILI
jgi:hypothetical protein